MEFNFTSQKSWDDQYSSGQWEALKSPLEYHRFEAVRNTISEFAKHDPTILEIGCGEGILQNEMKGADYAHFTGIDISKVAIEKANETHLESTYIVGDMEIFIPESKFDIIIFNESLYYSPNPVSLFWRYTKFVHEGGIIILSIYSTPINIKILNKVNSFFTRISTKETTNSRGTWFCSSYGHF